MSEFLADYGLFLLKAATVAVLAGFFLVLARARQTLVEAGTLEVEPLNERFEAAADALREQVWDDTARKAERKRRRKAGKTRHDEARTRVFVLRFDGDLMASAVSSLRHEITAVLDVARPDRDEVVLVLESPGGVVHGYGLAASQLARLRAAGLRLTVCVDKVAASGGYMMACVASEIVAAPFAVIGSIGVVAQIPNVHRLLKRHAVDVELLTAGEFKRTLTVLGENTPAGRAKFQQDLDETHGLFKAFVAEWRPSLDLARVATGEHWFGRQALTLGLVDTVGTSDDLLRRRAQEAMLLAVSWTRRRTLAQRLGLAASEGVDNLLMRWWQRGSRPLP